MAASFPSLRFADAPPRSADLVVIGGGIVGAATAYFAARAGLRTVLLEREGDYALWPPGVAHDWLAEEASVVVTVRWPSLPGDSRPVE